MQLGNKEYIKESIKQYYLEQLKEFHKEIQQKEKEIQLKAAEQIKRLREEALQRLQRELATVRASTLNEEKLKAKREYEMLREELIERVLQELKKKLPQLSSSQQYIKAVKRNMPKEYEYALVGNEKLKKIFKKAKISKGIQGVKFVTKDAVIDFTLDRMLEAKQDMIRESIAKEVFS
ncbi:MAG: hypothetical protein DRO04_02100 [Candidatus Iainarchaeum archaeon]|uniref:V-type proton ATPase subunit E n=1 Tax=Candidatus Iainarchaeum sp. TaxID=3101447 RepID=A0A497JH13_9ARCH|nr:MAG: hypothetical protein DRO04_02100 [Candidatus Diapherotrites archaeon]